MLLAISLTLLALPFILPVWFFIFSAAKNLVQGYTPGGLLESALISIYVTVSVYLPWCALTSENIAVSCLYCCPILGAFLVLSTCVNRDKLKCRTEIVYK